MSLRDRLFGRTPEQQSEYRPGTPVLKHISYTWRGRIKRALIYLLVALIVIVIAFPIYWMFSSAVRPETELFVRGASLIPNTISTQHLEAIFAETDFVLYYKNSIIVSAGVVTLTTVLATMGGYGLARISLPLKGLFVRSILLGYMFPAILLAIPMFLIWRQIGILNSFLGLILAETALALPFSLWLMWKFFLSVPYSLEESAQMMGASRFRAFLDIALPMSKPGIIAVAIFAYAISWNAFTIPKIIIVDSDKWVLTVGVATFTQSERVLWGEVMAASAMMVIPAFLFIYALQKYLLSGFRTTNIG